MPGRRKKVDLAAVWERCRPKGSRPYTEQEALFDACVLQTTGQYTDLATLGHRWNQSAGFIEDVAQNVSLILFAAALPEQPALLQGNQAQSRKTTAPDELSPDERGELWSWMEAHSSESVRALAPRLDLISEEALSYHRSKGNKFVDWPAAIRNWILKEAKPSMGRAPDPETPLLRVPTSQASRDLAELFGEMLKRRWPLAVEVGDREMWAGAIEALQVPPMDRENLIRWYCHRARDTYEFLPVVTTPLDFSKKWNQMVTAAARREESGAAGTIDKDYWIGDE